MIIESDSPVENQLAELLRQLRLCKFRTDAPASSRAIAENVKKGAVPSRNVYYVQHRWNVKFYFAGKQRTLGFFSFEEFLDAFRLADMVTLRFAALRVKAKVLTEKSFNLTEEQARTDIEKEAEINGLLTRLIAAAPKRQYAAPGAARMNVKKELAAIREQLTRLESLLCQNKTV